MNILPLRTLPERTKFVLDYNFFWPLKTAWLARKAFNNARKQDGFKPMTILFYPEKPTTYHTLYKICAFLGWKITNNPREDFDIALFFEDTTYKKSYPEVKTIEDTQQMINANCTDISKKRVDEVFSEVFGYKMSLDPTTHTGVCVKKSNKNAVHDGELIECPIEKAQDGYVYQKYVNTIEDDGRALDLRLHMFNGETPIVIKRYKNKDDLFHITVDAEFVNPDDVLTQQEKESISLFCEKMGFEYGEIDALRDNEDGKLYIVDVNDTPAGPIGPMYENDEDLERWFREVSKHVQNMFSEHAAPKKSTTSE